MPWYAWVMVTLYAISVLVTLASVGEPRKPLTLEQAALAVIMSFLMVWGIISLATT